MMTLIKTTGLFAVTAIAEIVGCYLPYLWLKQDKPVWLLVPAALSLAAFVWLLPYAVASVMWALYPHVGPYWMGIAKDLTGTYQRGLLTLSFPMLAAAGIMFYMRQQSLRSPDSTLMADS